MEYKKKNNTILLRLDKGDEITDSLKKVAETESIRSGFFSGIGATDDFCVGVFDLENKKYNEYVFSGNHEINALNGNFSTKDEQAYVHAHVTCTGNGGKVVGGHLLRAIVSLTCEIGITIVDEKVERRFDDDLGINRWLFEKKE